MNQEPTGDGWDPIPLRMSEYGIKWRHKDRGLLVTAYSDEVHVRGSARLTLDDTAFVASAFGLEHPTVKFGPKTACTMKEKS